MRISDIIEDFIKDMFEDDDLAVIQRNDLAEHFNCVPSQINYVISTRFTPTHGYYVESQRGGGGYIKIKKVNFTQNDYLRQIITNIGDSISAKEIDILVNNILDYGLIDEKIAKLIKSATNDKVLGIVKNDKDVLRAKIFKNILINLI